MGSKNATVFTSIIENWHNGNLSDARRRIRALTKYQVASLLIHGWVFIGNRDLEDDFQRFVLDSLGSKD
jgi:hypothetical protein